MKLANVCSLKLKRCNRIKKWPLEELRLRLAWLWRRRRMRASPGRHPFINAICWARRTAHAPRRSRWTCAPSECVAHAPRPLFFSAIMLDFRWTKSEREAQFCFSFTRLNKFSMDLRFWGQIELEWTLNVRRRMGLRHWFRWWDWQYRFAGLLCDNCSAWHAHYFQLLRATQITRDQLFVCSPSSRGSVRLSAEIMAKSL